MLFPFLPFIQIEAPSDLFAWIGLAGLFLGIVVILLSANDSISKYSTRHWIWLGILIIFTLLSTPFVGIQLSVAAAGQPGGLETPALMFLSALPWMICSGLVGSLPATMLGGLSGLILALLNTHDPFTPLEIASLALIFSLALRQHFRTPLYRLLRHPFISALMTIAACIPVFTYGTLLMIPGPLVDRLGYAISHLPITLFAIGGSLLLSGLLAEACAHILRQAWVNPEPLRPSPAESSLYFRLTFATISGAVVFLIMVGIADGMLASNIARSISTGEIGSLAWSIGAPVFGMVSLAVLIAVVVLIWGFGVVSRSLVTLTGEAQRTTQGQLDHSFSTLHSVDEVGRLRESFEQMRLSLTARLEELNRLLQVSQGVASSLVISDAIYPILEAAYNRQACLARVVLVENLTIGAGVSGPGRLSIGPAGQLYAYLDEEILKLTQQRGMIALNNLSRGRALNLSADMPHPGSLIAVALRHEAHFYGALWVAYDNPRIFSKEEISFLDTLAGEAALAAANAYLYSSAEVGRQRLEAILASTPEPVLVTDQQNRLLLTNPAAHQLTGLGDLSQSGQPVSEVIYQKELLNLLCSTDPEARSREIVFPNGRTYHTTVSTVIVGNSMLGKVCLLRDITHYKELDTQKSEFVATVSHDLRFPLTLIRGYATMLPMVGDLNEQQKGYVRKLNVEVENITRLVNNVLDLGRIEAGVGLKMSRLSARDIANNVIGSLQVQADQKSIQINLEIPIESQLELEADSSLLQEAVYNLVENAVKFTPVHGKVHVVVESLPESILFSVHDNGSGIAPIDQPRLFEKFYRGGQRDATQVSGSGLGLAIVKSIAERHGGRVWLESLLGKGSAFYLEVPRHPNKL